MKKNKKKMVISGKRKRRESPIIDSSPELPKRNKVQAQRKFAQGQSAPSSAAYSSVIASSSSAAAASNNNSQPGTPIRENREPPPELITHKRPRTEDFLTFLCFRGSSVLPSHLDFLNQNKNSTTGRTEENDTSSITPTATEVVNNESGENSHSLNVAKASTSKEKNVNNATKINTNKDKNQTVEETITDDTKAQKTSSDVMLFAVRKRADQVCKTATKVKRKNKDTNRRSLRTRGKAVNATQASKIDLQKNEKDCDEENIKEETEETPSIKTLGGKSSEDNVIETKQTKRKTTAASLKAAKSANTKENKTNESKKNLEITPNLKSTSETEDDRKTPSEKAKPASATTKGKTKSRAASPPLIPSPQPGGRMTRRRAFFEPVKPPSRTDEDKTQENTKKLPEKTDFSSDDEQPLATAIKTTKRAGRSPKKTGRGKKKADTNSNSTSEVKQPPTSISSSPARKRNKTATAKSIERLSPVIKQQEIEEKSSDRAVSEKSNKNYKKSRKREIDIRAGSISRKSDTSSKISSSKQTKKTVNTANKKLVNALKTASTPATDKESVNSSPKRKTKKSFDPNFSQKSHSQTDLSENDNRTASRPTRKTKEAATIYMELIGQKLNLDDFDDDDSSIDSFPELPNAKKTQKMENELKKNANTTKSGKQTKKRGPVVTGKTKEKYTVAKNYVAAASAKNIAVAADTLETTSKSSPPKQKEFISIDEKSMNTSTTTTEMKKLEKSFSDSDDEPLATKVINKPNDQDETTVNDAREFDVMNVPHKKSSLIGKINESLSASFNLQQHRKNSNTFNIINEPKPIVFEKEKKPEKISIETSKVDEKNEKIQKQPATKLKSASPPKQQQSQMQYQQINKQATVTTAAIPKIDNISPPKPQPPPPPPASMLSPTTSVATTSFPVLDRYPSPKVNPSFLTPKFDRNLADRHHRAAVAASITDFSGSSGIIFPSTSYIPKISGMSSPASKSAAAVAAATAMVEMSSITPKASPSPQNSTQSKKMEPAASTSTASIDNILAANLMPSKEESGKIFGIASVSLAQSSGPDNTKCTLGKCGSIHKPVLGPVVPTESYLGDQLSGKERRKAKVNMTHEQIQKWLIECSSNPDEIQDDLDDDFDLPLKPITFPPSPSPPLGSGCGGGFGSDEKESTSQSSSSKATKDNVKSESAWSCKGPSLKAVPVMKEDSRSSSLQNDNDKADNSYDIPPIPVVSSTKSKQQQQKSEQKQQKVKDTPSTDVSLLADKVPQKTGKQSSSTPITTAKNNKTPVVENSKSSPVKPPTSIKTPTTVTTPKATPKQQKRGASNSPTKSQKTTSQQNKQQKSSPTTTSSPKKTPSPAATSTEQKKTTPSSAVKNVKRQPVYNTKLSEPALKRKSLLTTKNSFSAFSAENETSVYSFDKEDDVPPPVAKPFRRHSRRESHYEDNSQATAEKSATPKTVDNEKLKDKEGTTGAKDFSKDMQQNNSISVTLSPEENSKLVKVSLDGVESPTKATSNTTSEKAQVNEFSGLGDSDSEGHTYYIPLQGIGQTSSADGKSDLIQGVAVKLGREGPEGPNQRVIMHATLVTKAQMGANTTPLPESMNVHEIVKNLLSSSSSNNKESTVAAATPATTSKSVPIGTVQPRFKSTSANAHPDTQQNPSGSGLSRVNSNSSLFSGSNKSRTTSAGPKIKIKDDTPIKMNNNTAFPRHDDPSQMVEAPIFRPTEKEFQDPIEFIERITPIAARFGICKIIPPVSFKPECRVSDDMRFTAYNQYVHKMLHRWGPSAKELSAIKKYLGTQSIAMTHPPWIGGMEVDLPRLYHTVQELGGLKEVIEKKKWARVAEEMCIPKLAQDRVTKLDDIYCKYLLPYDTLSPAERQKLFDEVEADWAKREARARRNADRCVNLESVSNEDDGASSEDEEESEDELDGVSMECIVKGKSMPLNQFFRIARNTMAVWFKNTEPTVTDIEAEFWRHVAVRDSHVCVHSGSIDSSGWGYGFPTPGPKGKGSSCAKHPWNLKVLTNNQGSVLRSLGPVMGVTVPTLHVGMLFSACCWYRDPHGLSWIEYLHTGASKIWYGIPDEQSSNFRSALTALIPTHCQNKTIWLPCDTVMVPPHMLTDRGVSLCRTEQKPGEFVVIFPRAYTSSVSTGYVVSESVYFATSSWLLSAKDDFKDIHDSCEPAMFSLEQLLFAIASDQRVTNDILTQILPMMQEVYEKEVAARQQLKAGGCTSTEKLEQNVPLTGKSKQKIQKICEEHECDLCRANLYISMVKTDEGNVYCLQHALKNINNGNVPPKQCKLIFTYNIEDIENLIKKINERLTQKKPISGSNNTRKIK